MPSPVYSAATTPGNVFSVNPLAAGKNAAAFLDISTCIEGQVTCELVTASQPGAATTFGAYKAYAAGASAPITLSGSVSGTTVPVNASPTLGYLHPNQVFAIVNQSSKVGELVTLSMATSGTGAQSLTITVATVGTYNSGDLIYPIAQTPSFVVTPANPSTGLWAASADYSAELFLGPAQWIIAATNGSAVTVGVAATCDRITAIQ
jgi:hypothetical protein